MATRVDLQNVLEELLGSRNVYYQPPESLKMNYPAIVYARKTIDNSYANNSVYKQNYAYEITVIDKNPDSEIVDKMAKFKTARFVRHMVVDNLNHDIFNIYY